MSRLDRHVAAVQGKLALDKFFLALASAALVVASAALGVIVVDKLAQLHPPRALVLLACGGGAAVVYAVVFAMLKKPTAHEAAVAIDRKLGLKEKFSTALFVRPSSDAFASAAVLDAERTAENVTLHKQFPLTFPTPAYYAIAVAAVAWLCFAFLPGFDLFGREAARQQRAQEVAKVAAAKQTVQQALATVNSYPKSLAEENAIKIAKRDLEGILNSPIKDPAQANRSALKALEEVQKAIQQKTADNEKFAQMEKDQKMLAGIAPPKDETGPVAEAQRSLAKGDYSKAVDQLNQAVKNFDKMSEPEKKKAADQMANMAKQLQQMAQNPQQKQQMQQQLQKLGMNQQQAQQLQQQIQQAAGDKQAQQQLQQMQQQLQQQMANNPQMQKQLQQMMQQMQAQAGSQQQAQQMQQAAQQMAQAMKQAAQQGQNGNPQQQQQNQQQMAQAQQQMNDQLGQMDAMAKDQQQMEAAQAQNQQNQQQAANNANGQGQGQGKQGQGNQPGNGQKGQWAAGNPNNGKQGNGMGGPGQGNGAVANKEEAPYTVKQEIAPSQEIEAGKVLASTFVKASSIKGESKVGLSQVAQSAMKDATDEVEQDGVSRQAQKVVKDYFETMQKGE